MGMDVVGRAPTSESNERSKMKMSAMTNEERQEFRKVAATTVDIERCDIVHIPMDVPHVTYSDNTAGWISIYELPEEKAKALEARLAREREAELAREPAMRERTRRKVIIVNRDGSVEHRINETTVRTTPEPEGWNEADGREEPSR